jgi:ribosomal protein S18 acetylase RimI-like enzyme
MTVIRVETDDEILSTREVMLQLRPEIPPDDYLATVRRLMSSINYRIVAATESGLVRAAAGYRIYEMLYCRRLLSVDDLVTDEHCRSAGFGRELLDWLKAEAEANHCCHVHLDSRVHRARAHRFYFREGFMIEAFHFMTTPPRRPETRGRRHE